MYCTAYWIYVWAGWVAKIRADVYHCPQLSERSAKLFDCFFGVSSTVITSTGTIGGWASIASASNVLDQGGLIRQPFALYWHFGLVSFEHNYYHPLYAIAIVCFAITSVPCAPFMAVRHTAKKINSKRCNETSYLRNIEAKLSKVWFETQKQTPTSSAKTPIAFDLD